MSRSIKINAITFFASKRPYIAWISAAVFYFYQYILRISPGVMINEIRTEFSVKAEEFATLGSIYLLLYALLQIPLGILVDKFGIKKIISFSIILCIIGSFIASIASSFFIMQLSRALIGAGSAAALLSTLKIIADNFSPGKRGILMGMTLTFGTIGAVFSGQAIAFLLRSFSWKHISYISAIFGIFILIIVFFSIPPRKEKIYENVSKSKNGKNILAKTVRLLRDKNIILYSILAIGLYAPFAAIADLWGVAFLNVKFNLCISDAAQINTMLYLGLGIGSIMLPCFFKQTSSLNSGIKLSIFLIFVIFSILLYAPIRSTSVIAFLLLAMGIFCGSEMMCFSAALQYADKNNSGEVIGVVNTLNMIGSAFLQQGIGHILDDNWDGVVDQSGLRIYSMQDFIFSLSILTVVLFCCWIISFALDSKHYNIFHLR